MRPSRAEDRNAEYCRAKKLSSEDALRFSDFSSLSQNQREYFKINLYDKVKRYKEREKIMENIKKITAALLTAIMFAAFFAGCKEDEIPSETTAGTSSGVSETQETIPTAGSERPVPEGETLAIDKLSVSHTGSFEYVEPPAENPDVYDSQLYLNGKARITITGKNFKEDYQNLEAFAENVCAAFKFNNLMFTTDTLFQEPYKTTVAGFDAIAYDYEEIVNTFENITEENPEGDKVEVERYNGKIISFFSDADVFYVKYDSTPDDYITYLPEFEEFVKNIIIS